MTLPATLHKPQRPTAPSVDLYASELQAGAFARTIANIGDYGFVVGLGHTPLQASQTFLASHIVENLGQQALALTGGAHPQDLNLLKSVESVLVGPNTIDRFFALAGPNDAVNPHDLPALHALLLSSSAREAGFASLIVQAEEDFGAKLGYSLSDLVGFNDRLDRGMELELKQAFGPLK